MESIDFVNKIKDSLGENYELINAFGELYNHFNVFGGMSSQVRDFIDNLNLSADKLNKLYDAYTTLQAKGVEISKDQWQSRYQNLLEVLAATGGDVTQSLKTVFSDIINDNDFNSCLVDSKLIFLAPNWQPKYTNSMINEIIRNGTVKYINILYLKSPML